MFRCSRKVELRRSDEYLAMIFRHIQTETSTHCDRTQRLFTCSPSSDIVCWKCDSTVCACVFFFFYFIFFIFFTLIHYWIEPELCRIFFFLWNDFTHLFLMCDVTVCKSWYKFCIVFRWHPPIFVFNLISVDFVFFFFFVVCLCHQFRCYFFFVRSHQIKRELS